MTLEAEQCIVGTCVASAEKFAHVEAKLAHTAFTDAACREAFKAMEGLAEWGQRHDAVALASSLDATPEFTRLHVGPAFDYLTRLAEAAVTYRMLDAYVEIVRSGVASRALVAAAGCIGEIARTNATADAKLADAASVVVDLAQDGRVVDSISALDATREAFAEIKALVERGGGMAGVSTGFAELDALTAGLVPGELTILGARPSTGKTAMALNIACAVAAHAPVHVFSMEMSASELAKRMLASLGRIDYGDLKRGKLDEQQEALLVSAGLQVKAMDMRIDDHAGLSIAQVRARARMAARLNKPGLIVVDYLTCIQGEGETQTLRVGSVSRGLKTLAKELECPVLCLAQLNRAVDSRAGKPQLSDLRDSGEIEQDADIAMFMHRVPQDAEDSEWTKPAMELIVAKNRNGATGSVYLEWIGRHQRFADWVGTPPVPQIEDQPAPRRSRLAKRGIDSFQPKQKSGGAL